MENPPQAESGNSPFQERLDELLDLWETDTPSGQEKIDKICANDPRLAAVFQQSIERLERFQHFTNPPPVREDVTPEKIGPYGVIRVLARGGSSTVYLCQQEFPERKIAVKLLHRDVVAARRQRRFRLEVQLLATLSHPGIAQIFDAGMHDGELPYFTMEYLPSERLDKFFSRSSLATDDKLRLFLEIADALHFAHQQGVIHRDLKPANILVTDQGQPKIIDFGIAQFSSPDEDDPNQQITRQLVGTAPYMSPEQFQEDQSRIGIQSDIYSLAVVIFEALTGVLPYDVREKSFGDCAQIICHDPPNTLPALHSGYDNDLNAVLQKSLAKDPRERYQAMADFREDLHCVLHKKPISAKPIGPVGQLVLWAKRNPGTAATSLGIAIVLAISSIISTSLSIVNGRQANELQVAVDDLQLEQDRSSQLNRSVSRKNLELDTVNQNLLSTNEKLRRTAMNANLMRAAVHMETDPVLADSLLNDEEFCPPDLRGIAWRILRKQCRGSYLDIPVARIPHPSVISTALSADGRILVSVAVQNVRWWNADDGSLLHSITDRIGIASRVAIDAKANRTLVIREDGAVFLIDRQPLKKTWLDHAKHGPACAVAVSPDGRFLAVGNRTGGVWIWNHEDHFQEPKLLTNRDNSPIVALAFGRESQRLAALTYQGAVTLYDSQNGNLLSRQQFPSRNIRRGEFSADLNHVCAGPNKSFLIWDRQQEAIMQTVDNSLLATMTNHPQKGLILASPPLVKTRSANGSEVVFHVGKAQVQSISLSTDQSRLAVGGSDGVVSLYDNVSLTSLKTIDSFSQNAATVSFSPDGKWIAVVGTDLGKSRGLHIHSTADGSLVSDLDGRNIKGRGIAFSKGSDKLATYADEGWIHIWQVPSGKLDQQIKIPVGSVRSLAISHADSRLFAVDFENHVIRICSLPRGEEVDQIKFSVQACRDIALNSQGTQLFSAHSDGTICHWDTKSQRLRGRIDSGQQQIRELALSPDGMLLAATSQRGNPWIWRIEPGGFTHIKTLQSQSSLAMSVDFSVDGTVLATGDATGHLVLWDAVTWQAQATLSHSFAEVHCVRFSPDGRFLAATGKNGKVHLWDITH